MPCHITIFIVLNHSFLIATLCLIFLGKSGVLFRSSLGYLSTLGPLIIVMLFSMVMEIKDDCFRHAQDRIVNEERLASVVVSGTVEHIKWKDVRVGQILLVRNKEEIPADMVLLSSSKVEGICYVEVYVSLMTLSCLKSLHYSL